MPTTAKIVSTEKPKLDVLEQLIQSKKTTSNEKMALKSYREKMDEKTGEVKVQYEVEGYGRYIGYASKGKYKTYTTGTSMKREHRNLLFGDDYDDLDIYNASGAIMCQIFEKNGLPTPNMRRLIENREDVLKEIQTYQPDHPLERATAKDCLIEIFFGGGGKKSLYWELTPYTDVPNHEVTYKLPPSIEELKREYNQNLHVLEQMDKYKKLKEYCEAKAQEKKKDYWIGQFASVLYQDEERKVLEKLVEGIKREATERKIENAVGALIYDGLHIKKELQVALLAERLEKLVEGATGYRVKLEIKDMEVSAEDRAEYLDTSLPLTYEAKKERFESTHFKTKRGAKPFYTLYKDYRNLDEEADIAGQGKGEFSVLNEDWVAEGMKFLTEWYADPHKRSYEDIVYECVKKENRRPNYYYAFPAIRHEVLVSNSTPEEKEKHIQHFKEYISLVAEGHPIFTNTPLEQLDDEKDEDYKEREDERKHKEHYSKWLTYYTADIILNPDTKGEQPIAMILWAKQGSGKTSYRNLMTSLLGHKLVHHTEDPTLSGDVLHEFNSSLKYKLFIEYEEINMKTHSALNDRIKAVITNHEHRITHKGHDAIYVKATERSMYSTNNSMSAIVEKGDRRYVAWAMSNKKVNDTTYWREFYEYLGNNNYIKDIAEYLLSFKEEVAGFAFRDERPITTYYKTLQQFSMPVELDFLKDIFYYRLAEMDDYKCEDEEGYYFIGSTEILTKYNHWREEHSLKEKVTVKAFSMKLKSLDADYGVEFKETSARNGFKIKLADLKATLKKDFHIVEEECRIILSVPERQGGILIEKDL